MRPSGAIILAGPFSITDAHGNSQLGVARLRGDAVSTPAPPLLTSVRPLSGAFSFMVNGEVGRTYIIQVTRDFLSWTPLATQVQSSVTQPFTDSTVSGVNLRFYRALVAQ